MKKILPDTEENPGNNQQQASTRTVKVSVVRKDDTETKIGSAQITIGSVTGSTGTGGGQATLSDVPEGEQVITVTAEGYKNYTSTITIDATTPTPIVIELEESD